MAVGFDVFFTLVPSVEIVRAEVTCLIATAVIAGLAAWNLAEYPEAKSSKEFLAAIGEKPKPLFIVYMVAMMTSFILTWVPQFYLGLSQCYLISQYNPFSGMTGYAVRFEPWYAMVLLLIMTMFWIFPALKLFFLERKTVSKRVRNSIRTLGLCLMGAANSIFFFVVVFPNIPSLNVLSMFGLGYIFVSVFFSLIAYSFREATALSAFVGQAFIPSMIRVSGGDHVVAFYTAGADKMGMFSTYILEGLSNGDRVVYVFPSSAELIEDSLEECGVNVKKHVKDGSLSLLSISEWYQGDVYDSKVVSRNVLKGIENAKKDEYKHLRAIVDYGDIHQVFKDPGQFFAELRKTAEKVVQPYLITLRTFNVETLSEHEINQLKAYYPRSLFISGSFSIDKLDAFSRSLGLKHGELMGQKILFEFTPTSNYEEVVEDFMLECQANGEEVIVFTWKGSSIHSALANRRELKFFYLTPKVSVPKPGASENEIFLPINNTSLLLDTMNEVVRTYSGNNISIIFDSLSALILTLGFDKTYEFLRYAMEVLASKNVTALFLFNPDAHEPKVASSLRTLFRDQVSYGKDGVQVIKLGK